MVSKVGSMSEDERLALLASIPEYEHFGGRDKDFYVAKIGKRYMYLKIPPGGFLHKHTDRAGVRRHYVLQTNKESLLFMDGEPHHLEVGGIYDMDGRIRHWSENHGDTDRIHFIDLKPTDPQEISALRS